MDKMAQTAFNPTTAVKQIDNFLQQGERDYVHNDQAFLAQEKAIGEVLATLSQPQLHQVISSSKQLTDLTMEPFYDVHGSIRGLEINDQHFSTHGIEPGPPRMYFNIKPDNSGNSPTDFSKAATSFNQMLYEYRNTFPDETSRPNPTAAIAGAVKGYLNSMSQNELQQFIPIFNNQQNANKDAVFKYQLVPQQDAARHTTGVQVNIVEPGFLFFHGSTTQEFNVAINPH